MKRRLTELELCEKYHNETQHTEYVTHLALKLFDRTRAVTGLCVNDKRLLEAACRLHDISYSENGKNHALRSAEIVTNEGLSGFTSSDRAVIAHAIALHSGRRCRMLAQNTMPGLNDRERMLKIAACLRIADGLDHGHIQSSSIRSVSASRVMCQIVVREDIYNANIEQARMKADLWENVFKMPFRIQHVRKDETGGAKFGRALTGHESLIEYARKLVCILIRLAAHNVEGAIMGVDPECLHDLRTSLRRTKAALRFFKPVLKDTTAHELWDSISGVCDKLSNARDSQVWMGFLNDFIKSKGGIRHRTWAEYLDSELSKNRRCLEELQLFLRSEEFNKPFRQVSFFARVEIPRLERERGRHLVELKTFIARRLRKAYKKMPRHKENLAKLSMEELHTLRRECRRMRYTAEFAAPALGRKALSVEKNLKDFTDLLGRIHDLDVYLQLHVDTPLVVSTSLRNHLEAMRRKAILKANRAWKNLSSDEFRNTVAAICRHENKARSDTGRSARPIHHPARQTTRPIQFVPDKFLTHSEP